MIKKVDHIGIAVQSLEAAVAKYEGITGKKVAHKEVLPEQKVVTAFFSVGETRLELLKDTDSESPIARFLEKRGEGIHHICFEVDDLTQTKKAMQDQGLRFIEGVSEKGANGDIVDSIARIAQTGVDYISVGALTHSAKALDLSLLIE